MIGGYCSHKDKGNHSARKGMILFRRFSYFGDGVSRPTDTTMVCVLSAISQMGLLEVGALVHGYIEKLGFTPEVDVFIGTGLVDMYSKCGCLNSAISVFELMRAKNVLTWTSMATGLALNGRGNETPSLLNRMAESGIKPNVVSFTSLLSAYRHNGLVQEGLDFICSSQPSRLGRSSPYGMDLLPVLVGGTGVRVLLLSVGGGASVAWVQPLSCSGKFCRWFGGVAFLNVLILTK
ncbi:PREDICTED: pentatricopeptide repeat-containing protein At3g18970-like [Brassica oleracea var. oleracea]|uniref:pentatricopeptide repeat-containing protein At3g18970-like n=1 Tax=Brassica oleracea var. oleracea TaxID=109376 RepID=UPI0006A6E6B1|nr:PREDICTED: pentatricopeptide repeat-containing protein At3g18970-like [Brassica oleracea var. oleracea]